MIIDTDGLLNADVTYSAAAKFTANAPLAMLDQYITNIKQLHAISFDAGDKDKSIAATIKTLDEALSGYKIDHGFEINDGDHLNRIGERIETKVLPFFNTHLSFDQKRK